MQKMHKTALFSINTAVEVTITISNTIFKKNKNYVFIYIVLYYIIFIILNYIYDDNNYVI